MRKKRIHQDESQFWGFIRSAALWGGLCYVGGFRGSELAKRALIGPVIERAGDFTLEEALAAAAEQERQKKALDEKISLDINKPLILPEIKQVSNDESETLTVANSIELAFESLMSTPVQDNDTDFRWLDLILPPSVILILGGKGSGKTALGFRLLEVFKNKLEPYIIALPKQCENLLPGWIGIRNGLEEVPPGSISLLDEAYLINHARDWAKTESREICRLLNLSRQQDKTIVFISQQSRHLNLDIVSSANALIIKTPGMLQPDFERTELRKIMTEARKAFGSIRGNMKIWSYVSSPDANFSGLVKNNLPSFWSDKLSNMYGYGYQGKKAADRVPSSMSGEERKRMAKELNQAGWSYSRIANYFGVSKGTVFNWIRNYPYKSKK